MQPATLRKQLETAAKSDDSYYELQDVASSLESKGVAPTAELIDTILRFMEDYRDLDYGAPGYLTQYMQAAPAEVRMPLLLPSLERRPTPDTIGMLYARIISTTDPEERASLTATLEACAKHPLAREDAEVDRVTFYLEALAERNASDKGGPKKSKKKGK
jgi:hypothetical protein